MKWFSRFFALYLLALSCIPCSDGDHQHVPAQTGSALVTGGDPAPHDQCNDVCSPFCGCQCCTTVYTIRAYTALPLHKVTLALTKQVFPHLVFRVDDVALAIDHPPQLV